MQPCAVPVLDTPTAPRVLATPTHIAIIKWSLMTHVLLCPMQACITIPGSEFIHVQVAQWLLDRMQVVVQQALL